MPRAGNLSIKVVFLKVKPGHESLVVDDLTGKLTRSGIEPTNYRIFKVFGEFDLVLVYREDSNSSLLYQGLTPHLFGSASLDCFSWQVQEEGQLPRDTFEFDGLKGPLLGVLFFKMKSQVLKKYGVEIDKQLVKFFNKDNHPTLGSFGWSDAIVFVSDDSMDDLVSKLRNMTRLFVTSKDSVNAYLPLCTYVLIGVDFALCAKALSSGRPTLNSLAPMKHTSMRDVYCLLELTFKPEFEQTIVHSCEQHFGGSLTSRKKSSQQLVPRYVMGNSDLILEIRMKSWVHFLAQLLHFRKKMQALLLNTAVRILDSRVMETSRGGEDPTVVSEGDGKYIEFDKNIEKIFEKLRVMGPFGHRMISDLYRFHLKLQDDLVSDDIRGLLPFVYSTLAELVDEEPAESDAGTLGVSDLLENAMDLFRAAVAQRSVGSHVLADGAAEIFGDYRGGIQKSVAGMEVIPTTLLKYVGVEWKGFIVVGSAPDYRHDVNIINVPERTWHDPSTWWGIFHETGHVFVLEHTAFKDAVLDDFVTNIPLSLHHLENMDLRELEERKEESTTRRFLIEVAADAFDLMFGFVREVPVYIETIWKYLLSEHANRVAEDIQTYLLRTICAQVVQMTPRKDIRQDAKKIRQLITTTIEGLKGAGLASNVASRVDAEDIEQRILALQPYLDYLKGVLLVSEPAHKEAKRFWGSSKFNKLANRIWSGELVTEAIEFPHLLVTYYQKRKLESKGPVPRQAKVALLRTLWYQSYHHEKIAS